MSEGVSLKNTRIVVSTLILFSSALATSAALADAISTEDLLSDLPYKGAVECAAVDPSQHGEMKVPVFTAPHSASKHSEIQQLKWTCAQGGGECSCFVMFLSEAPGANGKSSFIEVFDLNQEEKFWVPVAKDKIRPVTDLVMSEGALNMRSPEPPIFIDQELKHKISSSQMNTLTIAAEKQIRGLYPTPIGKLVIVAPRGGSKARVIVRSPEKSAQTESIVLSERMSFIVNGTTGSREFPVMKKEGNRYLIVTDKGEMPSVASNSGIRIERRAFWLEVDGAEVRFTPATKPVAVNESPLFGGMKYFVKERKVINGRMHARLEVVYQMDPILLEAEKPGEGTTEVFKLRNVWIPMTDDQGRLTFILEPLGGC